MGAQQNKKSLAAKTDKLLLHKKGMLEIDETAYQQVLQDLFQQKWESLKGERNRFTKMRKVSDFLIQKGFEPEFVQPLFHQTKE